MEKRLLLSVGTVLQERYEIIKLLGAGGMGAVYEAHNARTSANVALKETFATGDYEVSAFEREAKLLANLDHEALPRVMDYFAEGEGYFLVMELIRGEDLQTLLAEKQKPFETSIVLGWADQILDALEDIHSKRIVHRDIKPANIKLTPRGKIKLIDFGIAKGTAGDLTQVSTINAATGSYAPLEQILRASEDVFQMLSINFFEKTKEILAQGTDERADIYALGVTVYQLLTNRTPANAPTRALTLWSGLPDKLIPARSINEDVPEAVSDALLKAMSIEREGRFLTAAEMRKALREALKPAEAGVVRSGEVILKEEDEVVPPLEPANIEKKDVISPFEPAETEPSPIVKDTDKPNPRPFIPEETKPSPALDTITPIPEPTVKTNKIWIFAGAGIGGLFLLTMFWLFGQPILFNSGNKNKNGNVAASNINQATSNAKNANVAVSAGQYAWAQTLSGHSEPVNSIAFSPDGKTIASGSRDATVKLWDASSGTLKQTLTGHTAFVNAIAFSPDGKTIASGSRDKTIKLWDASSGNLKQTLKVMTEPEDFFLSVAFSPDGKTLAAGSTSYTVKLWDAADGTLKQTLTGYDDSITSIAYSPDGKTLAVGNFDGKINLRDASSGAIKQTLAGHDSMINSLVFSPDGKTLASGSNDKTIKLWDASSGKIKETFTEENWVTSVAFSPDGRTLAEAVNADAYKIQLRYLQSGIIYRTFNEVKYAVNSVAFAPDGKTLAGAGDDNTINLWRLKENITPR